MDAITSQAAAVGNRDDALLDLLDTLEAAGYDFVTVTPATHARVLRRPDAAPGDPLRRLLGWSLPVPPGEIPGPVLRLLKAAKALAFEGDRVRSTLRVSRLHGLLFLHSAYPTTAPNAVFLGPDSYRFADFVVRELSADFAGRLVDVGGGCGVGGIVAARRADAAQVLVTDVNRQALALARINAWHAGAPITTRTADGLNGERDLDLIIANPPYMANRRQTYSDGGDQQGRALSLEWTRQALDRLKPGGRLMLYTGVAIGPGGVDPLRHSLTELCARQGAALRYAEIDPDVFGEELETEAYADTERIAVVGCVVTASDSAA